MSFLLTENGVNGKKVAGCSFTPFTTPFTMSIFMRRGSNSFAQIASYTDTTIWVNYDLLMGQTGTASANVIATMTPWRDGWFMYIMTTSSTTATALVIFIVSSTTSPRAEANTLTTSIYVAGAQAEAGLTAISYIPTTAAPVTRAVDDFEEVLNLFPSKSVTSGSGITTSHRGCLMRSALFWRMTARLSKQT
jgi:hypothetical protein